jgi:hypothetical protein
LLHIGAIGATVAGDVQDLTAVNVSNSVLPATQVDEFPALICSIVATELLHVGVLVGAASEDVNAPARINIAD